MTTLSRERVQELRNLGYASIKQPARDLVVALCDSWLATDVGEVKRWKLMKRYESRSYGTQYEHMKEHENGDYVLASDYDALAAAHRAAVSERDAAQARIDALMLEYCPDEMSAEQRAKWARNQHPVSAEERTAIDAALQGSNPTDQHRG